MIKSVKIDIIVKVRNGINSKLRIFGIFLCNYFLSLVLSKFIKNVGNIEF